MGLELNSPNEYIRIDGQEIPFFREGYGQNVKRVAELLSSGRTIMNMAQLARRRIDVREYGSRLENAWNNNYFDTSDLKAQREGEVKLILTAYADGSTTPLGREALSWINPKERLVNGAVDLRVDDRYDRIRGAGVAVKKVEDLAEAISTGLIRKQARDSFFWRFFYRHPDEVPEEFAIPGLHEEAIEHAFADQDIAMGVYVNPASEIPEMRAWYVGRLGDRSDAYGRRDLDDGCGRFLGLAPEALVTLNKGVAPRVERYTTADLEEFDEAISTLKASVKPELLEPLAQLRDKL